MAMRAFAITLCVVPLAGCSEKRPAADTAAAVAVQSEAEPPADAAPSTSRIGQLPLFNSLAADGACQVRQFEQDVTAALVAELTFEETLPTRVIKVAIAPESRGFRVTSVDIAARRDISVGREAIESVYATFDGAGNVQGGNRQYYTSDGGDRERQPLLIADAAGESAKQVALQVMNRCMPSGG
jgi:hypothetical protein